MDHWGVWEENPVLQGKVMILALNTVSLKSLGVVPVDFEVFELQSAQLNEYGMIYSTVFIANTCP